MGARTAESLDAAQALERVLRFLPEAPERAAREARQTPGWSEAARSFGLGPLLAHYLGAGVVGMRGAELLAAQFAGARLARLTVATLDCLAQAQIPAVLLKGLGLGARLYPKAWMRPSVDVDVLIAPADLERADQALPSAGWRRVGPLPTSQFEFSKDVAFQGPHRELLELHFGFNSNFQTRFDTVRLLQRARPLPTDAGTIRVLHPVDDLAVQAVHAAHHSFAGVKWLFDLKLSSAQSLDWAELVGVARRDRAASAVGLALAEAARRVHAPVPRWVLAALGPGALRAAVARQVASSENVDVADLGSSLLLADRPSLGLVREALVRPAGRALVRAGLGDRAKRLASALGEHVKMLRRDVRKE